MGKSRNKTTYTAASIVNHYARLDWLQPAEVAILEKLRSQLANMKMLDMGVGGGRTTLYFAPLVKQYVGIDYSPKMIAACQQRFKDSEYPISFEICDARDLSQFGDNSFDFILFSYNGIDSVSHTDRLKIFAEVKRVGKPGCYFFFSSHNLQTLEKGLTWQKQLSINPFEIYLNLVSLGLFWLFNRSINRRKVANSDYLIVRDESHMFGLDTYYIRAAQQLKYLSQDFSNVEIYPWKSKERVLEMDAPIMETELWLYYLCQNAKEFAP
ncbi:MAG: class I SAM-dependent methyltransferase [Symploca sp. SIO2G7]|nr:class I SAM-dependent methyltransferase [Symploca sp. SIO2G7]